MAFSANSFVRRAQAETETEVWHETAGTGGRRRVMAITWMGGDNDAMVALRKPSQQGSKERCGNAPSGMCEKCQGHPGGYGDSVFKGGSSLNQETEERAGIGWQVWPWPTEQLYLAGSDSDVWLAPAQRRRASELAPTRIPASGFNCMAALTERLPPEIIIEIIQAAPRTDQASLCRVSRLLNTLGLHVLNHTVVTRFSEYSGIHAFCAGLIANPVRADAIRSHTFFHVWRAQESEPLRDMMLEALKFMSGLERLSVTAVTSRGGVTVAFHLSSLTFPRLVVCQIRMNKPSPVDTVASFFRRHPTITHLDLVWVPSGAISLPNLRLYEGPAETITTSVTRNLTGARLRWREGLSIDEIVIALNSLTDSSCPFVSSHDDNSKQYRAFLPSLARHMPHTTSLQIRGSDDVISNAPPFLGRTVGTQRSHLIVSERRRHRQQQSTETVGRCLSDAGGFLLFAWRKVDGTWREFPVEDFLGSGRAF
ncbi:hypothetical protein DFH07DRAFT_990771 [Mycena maculata]|uniref:F-box domain-containing protein n=1 Tax=Mycena maculata TaxID=230809 RepID=A0AAD7MUE8_9AGAR|nr:hypothetical protein DFH07DRAFT_990771 [Mycena maculata]